MSECKHDLTPNYQGYFCCICDIEFDQYEVIEQLKASEAECERLSGENLTITNFYTDLCDRLPKGSCEILGHGWHNVEQYIKRHLI
jgi:hypothetical protein